MTADPTSHTSHRRQRHAGTARVNTQLSNYRRLQPANLLRRRARPAAHLRYVALIVGASIHMGKHDKSATDYVRKNLVALERLPSAFFSVSLAAQGDAEEAQSYVEDFEKATGWRPAKTALFSGALLYTRYGFFKRRLMKKIVEGKPGNLGTDTSRDYVYTEWDGVRRFTEDFLEEVVSGVAGETNT
jgi:menaquinone-dependent protoporphyrinogen oxidase